MAMTRALNAMDASLLVMETPVTPMHIGGGSVFRLPQGAGNDFVRRLHDRWRKFPIDRAPFNYRLSRAALSRVRPQWEIVDNVVLSQHFFRIALPYPGNDRELEQLLARLHSKPLDRSRPLWEMYLIEGLSDHRFAMYTKIHHALMDGASAMRIFMAQYTENPKKVSSPPVWTMRGRSVKRSSRIAARSLSMIPGIPLTPGVVFELAGRAYRGVGRATALVSELLAAAASVRAPDTIFNGPITTRREIGQAVFEFARVKALSKALGCTINDIALTVCGGALRRYLQGIDALPRDSLVCVVPISLNKHGNAEGGNTVTAAPVSLGTDIDDVRKRLEAVRASMLEVKERMTHLSVDAIKLATALMQIPVVVEQVSGRWLLPHRAYNVILSNVPGPQTPLYLCGAEFVGSIPAPMILRGMGLNITITSLLDRIWFSYTTCPDIAPHIDRLGPLIIGSFDELERVMSQPPRRAAARRTSRRPSLARSH
jgi:diacylglycerol O-acyltransferase